MPLHRDMGIQVIQGAIRLRTAWPTAVFRKKADVSVTDCSTEQKLRQKREGRVKIWDMIERQEVYKSGDRTWAVE